MTEAIHRALAVATDTAREAGALLRRAFHHQTDVDEPDGKASADRDAEDLIRARLTAAFPTFGFRAEERPDANRGPKAPDAPVWLVDPNDGTSAFQKGYRGASVSIALIASGRPVLGVVFAYAAPDDRGDLFAWAEGCGPLQRNGLPIVDPEWPAHLTADDTVFVSNSADSHALANATSILPARYQPVPGIAYRLALAAAGDGAAATSLFHPRDFDYAAGHALLRGVGGVLLDERGRSITYDPDKPTRAGFCFGGAPSVCRDLSAFDWSSVIGSPRSEREAYDLVRPSRDALTADAERLSRAHGCWLGLLVGDALGAQVGFSAPAAIDASWPDGVNAMLDAADGSIAGQMSAGAERAHVLARAIVERGGFDIADADDALRWCDASDPAAADRPSTAMARAIPVAIAGHGWSERALVAAVRAESSLARRDPLAADCSAALALGISFALREGPTAARVHSHVLAGVKALGFVPAVVDAVADADRSGVEVDPTGTPTGLLTAALRQMLLVDDVANALMDCVALGGDAASRAGITGALLGAVHGREALPWIWRDRVLTCRPMAGLKGVGRPRPRAFWPVDAMTVAERLLHAGDR